MTRDAQAAARPCACSRANALRGCAPSLATPMPRTLPARGRQRPAPQAHHPRRPSTPALPLPRCAILQERGRRHASRLFLVLSGRGLSGPGPSRYDRVRVLRIGSSSARHVLVLLPGTSAGAGYFVPVAEDLVAALHGWQVWAVDRRENLLEDPSSSTARGPVPSEGRSCLTITSARSRTRRLRGTISRRPTSGSHSRGGGAACGRRRRRPRRAYRTGRRPPCGPRRPLAWRMWIAHLPTAGDFGGRAGARDLDGLVLIDGASGGSRRSDRPTHGRRSPRSSTARRSWPRPARGCRGSPACSAPSARRWPCASPTRRRCCRHGRCCPPRSSRRCPRRTSRRSDTPSTPIRVRGASRRARRTSAGHSPVRRHARFSGTAGMRPPRGPPAPSAGSPARTASPGFTHAA